MANTNYSSSPRAVPYGTTESASPQPSSYPNPLSHSVPLEDRLNHNTSLLYDNFEPYESFASQGHSRFDDLAEIYLNPMNINDDNNERQLNANINQYQFSGSHNADASTPWSSNAGIGRHLVIGTNSPEQVQLQDMSGPRAQIPTSGAVSSFTANTVPRAPEPRATAVNESPGVFRCETCKNKAFTGKNARQKYQRHLNTHSLPFLCPYVTCDRNKRGFSRNDNLQRHLLTLHGEKEGLRTEESLEYIERYIRKEKR
ncbi:hypothetical protein BDD12DRAFT_872302 [Trichophaea hybrida]|nr:hypothetical protein BDD12DRAFT_872302 [Trichophaea hybrida]